jgi:hypothetical protein
MSDKRSSSSRSGPYTGWQYVKKRMTRGPSGFGHRSTESLAIPVGSSGQARSVTAPQQPPNASSNASSGPQQQTFAQAAASGLKRTGLSAPANPRPELVRGAPYFEHPQYMSMERPAPPTASDNVLYVDLRSSDLSAAQALDAAQEHYGEAVLGFQFFAGQKCLALVFSSSSARDPHIGKRIGKTDLSTHTAFEKPMKLMKLTLSGVPLLPKDTLLQALRKEFATAGDLVYLAPLMYGRLISDQWHVTLSVNPEHIGTLPRALFEINNQPVIVDIPGERRWCRHCNGPTHTKASCRQGQRLRAKQRQQQLDQQRLDDFLRSQEDSSSDDAFEDAEDPSSLSSSSKGDSPPPPPPAITTDTSAANASTTTTTTVDQPQQQNGEAWMDIENGRPQADRIQQAEAIVAAAATSPHLVTEQAYIAARLFLTSVDRDNFRQPESQ